MKVVTLDLIPSTVEQKKYNTRSCVPEIASISRRTMIDETRLMLHSVGPDNNNAGALPELHRVKSTFLKIQKNFGWLQSKRRAVDMWFS
jgi:hypothetical protein